MLVTVIADASYCPFTKGGGYGYHVVSDRGKHSGGGTFIKQIRDSTSAEMMALVNAMWHALAQAVAVPGDHMLLQTDCLAGIHSFQRGNPAYGSDAKRAKKALWDLAHKHRLGVTFMHVKGHTDNPEARFAANRACDERARIGMLKARTKFRREMNDEE